MLDAFDPTLVSFWQENIMLFPSQIVVNNVAPVDVIICI
jgi:hypothetical protein